MVEILQNLEQTAIQYRPIVLVGPGLACSLIGLIVWLGGLGLRRALALLLGAAVGGVCGFFIIDQNIIIGHNIILMVIVVILGGAVALILGKIFISILSAGLAVAVALVVFMDIYKADFGSGLDEILLQLPTYSLFVMAALGIVFILAGLFLWRVTAALCYSTLGAILVFAGMVLLLLYKGAMPISCILARQQYYVVAFGAMVAGGTIEQLVFCRSTEKGPKTKREKRKDKEQPNKTTNWRGR